MRVVSLAERPDLAGEMSGFDDSWPPFMLEDATALLMGPLNQRFPGLQLLLLDGGTCVGKAHAVPFHWDGEEASLPDRGWDEVLLRSWRADRPATAVSALEITLRPAVRGRGLSRVLLGGLREAAHGLGFTDLFAPVRPSRKSEEPHVPIAEYASRLLADGLPYDPWLRVHARAGGRLVRVCPLSMTITGTLPQWRAWTGLPFDTDGDTVVPGALVPVSVSRARDLAVYVEPNVWVRHRTTP